MFTIYHNPRCKKSRAGLQYLQEKTQDINIIEYLKKPVTFDTLKDLLVRLNKKPHDLIRTQESMYKKNFKGKNFNDDEWIQIMTENPKLIKRPIVVKGNKAVWGDPPEEIEQLF